MSRQMIMLAGSFCTRLPQQATFFNALDMQLLLLSLKRYYSESRHDCAAPS